ncbi:PAS domain-containing protein [Pseudoalteromonas marina]|jgi:PAS domain S-box-containing protein|uniref:PAS domain-containing protein n=2 Tax=Pseudoalteromonas TaxID=53246 RepID=UPI00003101BC|nr:PAS domain-containing protein [uncultured Pseudoalteromonas sp.]
MFFSNSKQNEIASLKAELYPLQQVWEGLNREMLVINILYDGRISHANEQLLNMLGYRENHIINTPLLDIISEHSQHSDEYKSLQKAIKKEGHWGGRVTIYSPRRSSRVVTFNCSPCKRRTRSAFIFFYFLYCINQNNFSIA